MRGRRATRRFHGGLRAPLSVLSISPDLGDIFGGAELTITITGGTATSVLIGGTPCTSLTQQGKTLRCIAPAKVAGLYSVQVTGAAVNGPARPSAYEAWHETTSIAAARVYQSDQQVTSGGSATRRSWGAVCQDDGIEGLDPILPGPFDGQGFLELPSGRLIRAGGAPNGHASPGPYPGALTNALWSSDDRSRSWQLLLAKGAASATRPAPAHTFGFFRFVWAAVDYVYWAGSDPFVPSGDVFRIPSAALDVGGDPSTPWERVSTTCPTSGWALYFYGPLANVIYVGGGQVDINNGAANKDMAKSVDGGATWTLMPGIVPATVWGTQVGRLPEKGGKLWIAGSGRYDAVVNDFSNAVHSFDGTSFTEVLANGHSQFPKSRYHALVVDADSNLWRFNGSTWDGVTFVADTASAFMSADGATWTRPMTTVNFAVSGATNVTPIVITTPTHGLATGASVTISNVGGNTAANGTWTITVLTGTTFSLDTSVGNGAYTASTGTATVPVPMTIPWGNTHAQAAIASADGIYLTEGFQSQKVYAIRAWTGALASAWEDQGSGALDLSQATAAKQPLLVLAAMGRQPGIVGANAQRLALAAPDRDIAGGRVEFWFVARTLNFDAVAALGSNNPCVIIGSANASIWNSLGYFADQLQFRGAAPTTSNLRGSGYNDDQPRLLGVSFGTGDLRFYEGETLVGTIATDAVFNTSWTGWDGILAGLSEADGANAVIGEVIVLRQASDATFRRKMAKKAKKWGSIT